MNLKSNARYSKKESKKENIFKTRKQIWHVLLRVILGFLCVIVIAIFGIGIWHIVRNIDNGVTEGSSIRYYNSWKYTQGQASPYEMRQLGKSFARNTVIKVNDIHDNGDGTATADITVDTPDFTFLLTKNFENTVMKNKGQNRTYDEVLESVENHLMWDFYFSNKRTKTDIQIQLVKENDQWKIVRNDAYNTVVTGDAMTAYHSLLKMIYEEDLE